MEEGLKISVDPKYVEKVIDILEIRNPRFRKVPATHNIQTRVREASRCSCSRYRAALGCLLYIAPDRPDLQRAISWLARGMSAPTSKQMRNLKYLAEYAYYTRDYSLILRWRAPGVGLDITRERSQGTPWGVMGFEEVQLTRGVMGPGSAAGGDL